MKSSNNGIIRLIAVFKFLKAALLIALGVGALRFVHRDITASAEHWAEWLKLDPGNHYLNIALAKASHVRPQQIKKLGLGSFLYAGLFLTEGIGLWMLKRWAEWLTVIITGSLLPLEVYEIHRHPTPIKFAVLAINVAIVVYLIYRIRNMPSKRN